LPRAKLVGVPGTSFLVLPESDADSVRAAAGFVRANVPEDRRIYVGTERHDVAAGSWPILYFVCGRLPAVRTHALDAGVTDREEVQADMIGWIAGNEVRCVLLRRLPRSEAGAPTDVLDLWLAENYVAVQETPGIRILTARE
jgi:hypothetical protein